MPVAVADGRQFALSPFGMSVDLPRLLAAGVPLRWFEALAVVRAAAIAAGVAEGESPDLSTIHLDESGRVTTDQRLPTLQTLATFLARALPRPAGDEEPKVPPGLRYTVVRALGGVAVPPFESVGRFSEALARFERPDRELILRGVYDRWAATTRAPAVAHAGSTDQEVGPAPMKAAPPPPAAPPPTPRWDELTIREPSPSVPDERSIRTARRVASRRAAGPLLTGIAVAAALVAAGTVAAAVLVTLEEPRRAPVIEAVASSIDRLRDLALGPAPPAQRTTASAPAAPAADAVPTPAGRTDDVDTGTRPAAGTSGVAPASPAAETLSVADRMPGELVQGLGAGDRPIFSSSFASTGSAIFLDEARSPGGSASKETRARGGRVHVLSVQDDGAKNYHPRLSPDGARVAFDSDRDGERGVYLSDRDGRNIRRVSGSGYAAVPSWAPDGTRLAYVRAEPANPAVWNIWMLDLGRGETQRLTSHRVGQPWGASWLPDGRRLCYAHEDRFIVLDTVTGGTKSYASPIRGAVVQMPAVSPDGRLAIFQVYQNGAWLLDLASGAARKVLDDPTAEDFAWAPDGDRVAFHSRRERQWGIWMMR